MLTVLLGSMGKSIARLCSLFTPQWFHLLAFDDLSSGHDYTSATENKKENKTKIISFELCSNLIIFLNHIYRLQINM